MGDREKLTELIGYCSCIDGYGESLITEKVGYLLANGVTVKKYGRWMVKYPLRECGICGEIYSELGGNADKAWNYCPCCGAKMEE